MKKGVKSEFYILIERLLHITITEDEHSDIVCRNCQRRLTTIDKHLSQFKAVYEDARNTLKRTHGHKVTKRLASDNVGASSKKALFPDDMTSLSSGTDPESDRYLLLQVCILVIPYYMCRPIWSAHVDPFGLHMFAGKCMIHLLLINLTFQVVVLILSNVMTKPVLRALTRSDEDSCSKSANWD